MKHKSILAMALLANIWSMTTFYGLSAKADELPFQTELGFKRLSDLSTPENIKKASESVFEVRVPEARDLSDVTVVDLTDPRMVDFESKIAGITPSDKIDEKEKIVILSQIKNCRKSPEQTKNCALMFSIQKATAFLAGDSEGTTLWTNAHVVNGFLNIQALARGKSILDIVKDKPRMLVFVFNQQGELVFDPFKDTAQLQDTDEPSYASLIRGKWFAEDSDFVSMKLSRKIGQSLKIGVRAKSGDRLYHPGYAACTGCARNPNVTDPLDNNSRGPGQDSNGIGLYWTAGEQQDLKTVTAYLEVPSGMWDMYKKDQMIFFSADAQVGMSGGPILNADGQVIGVFAGSKPKMVGATMLNLSRGVRPSQFDKAQ
jgi:hypothetical protein